MKEKDKLKNKVILKNIKNYVIKFHHILKNRKKQRIKPKLKKEKTTRNQFGRSSKSSVPQIKRMGNNDILGLKINRDIIADHSDLAEKFIDYFINIAAKLKEPNRIW